MLKVWKCFPSRRTIIELNRPHPPYNIVAVYSALLRAIMSSLPQLREMTLTVAVIPYGLIIIFYCYKLIDCRSLVTNFSTNEKKKHGCGIRATTMDTDCTTWTNCCRNTNAGTELSRTAIASRFVYFRFWIFSSSLWPDRNLSFIGNFIAAHFQYAMYVAFMVYGIPLSRSGQVSSWKEKHEKFYGRECRL